MNRKWIIPLSVAAVAVIAIGAGNYYALSRQAVILGEAIAGKIVAAEGDWRLHKRKDEFSGKESCTIMNAKNPHLWVLDGLMMVRYADRGRLESYVIRVDDRDPESYEPSADEISRDAAFILTRRKLKNAKRLRVRAFTRSAGLQEDDIELTSLWALEAKRAALC